MTSQVHKWNGKGVKVRRDDREGGGTERVGGGRRAPLSERERERGVQGELEMGAGREISSPHTFINFTKPFF